MNVSVLTADQLTADHLAAWRVLQSADPALRSPFFCPEFTQAVARVRDDVRVAVVDSDSGPRALFPFQQAARRRAVPIGFPFSDYHGVIAAADLRWTPVELLRGCGLSAYDFRYVPIEQSQFAEFETLREESPAIDLSDYQVGSKEGRKLRKLGREVGEVCFLPHTNDRGAVEQLIRWKRQRFRQTGVSDQFKDDWIRRLLFELQGVDEPAFEGRLSALYAGERLVAAHLGVRSADVWHWWFPAFDADLGKYSPGLLMLLELIKRAQAEGFREFDFGVGDEGFKHRLANSSIPVMRGSVSRSPLRRLAMHARSAARNLVVKSPLNGPMRALDRWIRG